MDFSFYLERDVGDRSASLVFGGEKDGKNVEVLTIRLYRTDRAPTAFGLFERSS